MPTVKQINPEKTPELFYLPSAVDGEWTGDTYFPVGYIATYNGRGYICAVAHTSTTFAVDFADSIGYWDGPYKLYDTLEDSSGASFVIYNKTYEEEVVITGKKRRRRVKGGVQSTHLEPELMSYYYDTGEGEELVCTARIIPQYWQVNHWADFNQPLDQYIELDSSGHLTGEGVQGEFSWTVDLGFEKWTANITAPGFTVRAVWEITFTALGQQLMSGEEPLLKLATDDYTGNVLDDEGVVIRTIIFEPDGVIDGITVDPYLYIEDHSTYIYVICDGFIVNVLGSSTTLYSWHIRNPADNATWYSNYFNLVVSAAQYYSGYGIENISILENTSIRVWIRQSGVLSSSSGSGNPLTDGTNDVLFINDYFIYDDMVIFKNSVEVPDGSVTLDAIGWKNTLFAFSLTNNYFYYESSDSEVQYAGYTYHNTSDYFVSVADECNAQLLTLDYSINGGATYFQSILSGSFSMGYESGTITTGITQVTNILIIDSPERESGDESSGKMYSATERIALGNQWKDTVGPAITEGLGAQETDWLIPLHIGTGICADGTQRLGWDGDSTIKITADRDRVNYKAALEPQFLVGDPASPTDLLVGHWKCEDNAASTTVVDDTGNNNALLEGGDNTSVKHNTDSLRGGSLLLNGTDDDIEILDALNDLTDMGEFTLYVLAKPNFAYNVGADQGVCYVGDVSGEFMGVTYSYADDYYKCNRYINSSAASVTSPVYTENYSLQEYTLFGLHFSYSNNTFYFSMKWKIIGRNTLPDTWVDGTFYYGTVGTWPQGAYYIDDIILLNACVLPFGAFFDDRGKDYANPHEEVTFSWSGSDTTGVGSDVTSAGDYSSDGPIGAKAFNPTVSTGYATAVTSGNISSAEGALSFWVQGLSSLSADSTFFFADTNFRVWWDDSDNDIVFTYGGDTVRTATAITDANWHHVKIEWDASNYIRIIVDGYNEGELDSEVDSAPTLDTNMYFNADDSSGTNLADVLTSDWFITSSMTTPEIWTALGQGPLLLPQVLRS